MRFAPLGFAILAAGLFGLAGSGQAQVNLLHPAHHVYIAPKVPDRPAGNTTGEAPAATTPSSPSAPQATATPTAAPASPPKF